VISHCPLAQLSLAFASEHDVPQAPQFVSVVSDVSQPFASIPSQFANPVLQKAIRHVLPVQSAVALARVQSTPQPPQLVSVERDVSQPFGSMPSQFE